MSEQATGTEKTFVSVNGKSLDGTAGDIRFIRPKQLAADGVTGVIVQGVYEGTMPNAYDAAKPDYKIREDGGTLVVLNSTGSLAKQFAKVEAGTYVQVQYLGMQPIKTGKMAGKLSHSFILGVEATDAE